MAGNLFDLTDRVAVVAATPNGMRRAMSIVFAEYGADSAARRHRHCGHGGTAEKIETLGRRAVPAACDSSDPHSLPHRSALVDTPTPSTYRNLYDGPS